MANKIKSYHRPTAAADDAATRLSNRLDRISDKVSRSSSSSTKPNTIPIEDLESFFITDKDGNRVRFKLWSHQKKILRSINRDMERGKPIRLIHDKPRQCGSSTFFALVVYWLVTRLNLSAVIMGHLPISSSNLYDKVKYAYKYDDFMDKTLDPPERENQKILEFSGGGKIRVVTFGSKDAVTSTTNQVILATEQALWESTKAGSSSDQMRGMLNTMSQTSPMTFVFVESTGRPGTDFQDRWNEASKGNSAYDPIFIPWFEIEEYQLPFLYPADAVEFMKNLSEEETELVKAFGVSAEQLKWRRHMLYSVCRGTTMESKLIDFHSEYPSTPEESFTCSDAAVFEYVYLNRMMESLSESIFTGEITYDTNVKLRWVEACYDKDIRNSIFVPYRQGRARVWFWPERNRQYVLASDVSEGIEVKNYERDDSAFMVRDAFTGKVMMTWCGKIPPDELADLIRVVGLAYNIAFVCVENNNMGAATNLALWKSYPKYAIYMSKVGIDQEEVVQRAGFQTGPFNKPRLVTQLAAALKAGKFECHDENVLHEMLNCVRDSRGKINTNGKDLLMAAVLSEEARINCPNWNIAKEEKPVDMYKDWKNWKKQNEKAGNLLKFQLGGSVFN